MIPISRFTYNSLDVLFQAYSKHFSHASVNRPLLHISKRSPDEPKISELAQARFKGGESAMSRHIQAKAMLRQTTNVA
jgi:hypothetical protein